MTRRVLSKLRSRDRPAILVLLVSSLLLLSIGAMAGLALFRAHTDTTWRTMQQRKSWRIGIDPSFPPFEYLDESGAVVGFDVELAREIAAMWDFSVEIIPTGFDSLLDAVRAGQVDSVVSALPYDPRLTKDISYSIPYFDAGIRLAVRTDSNLYHQAQRADWQKPEDLLVPLADHRIGVEWGGLSDIVGRRLQQAGGAFDLVPFASPDETITALLDDPSVEGIFVDNVTLLQAQFNHPIAGVGPMLETNPYVIASPIDATILQANIDAALTSLQESGQIERLIQKWY